MRVAASWHPVSTRREKVIGARLSLIDVTGNGLCQQSRTLFQNLFLDQCRHRTDMPVCMMRSDGSILYWNAGAEAAFGWTERERIGVPLKDMFPPPDADRLATELSAITAGTVLLEASLRCKDGGMRRVRITLHGATGLDGLLSEVVCVFQDVEG